MINSMDKEQMTQEIVDRTRVLMNHRSAEPTSEDLKELGNFLDEMLSKYVDNKHIHGDV